MEKIRLFCLPYAGASAHVFLKFRKGLHPSIELSPVELAGRGSRMDEPFHNGIAAAARDVYSRIQGDMEHRPYAFWGHSMGGLIVFEVLHLAKAAGIPDPRHVFLSACRAPQAVKRSRAVHKLSDEDLKEEILLMGGTPPEALEQEEFLRLFLPVLRADYRAVETYEFPGDRPKLTCDITAVGGDRDALPVQEMLGWREVTQGGFRMIRLSGDHFFIHDNVEAMAGLFNSVLTGGENP